MLIAPLKTAHEVAVTTAEILRPPRRMPPSEAAARYLQTEKGPWIPELVPYCSEPLDLLAGREYRGIVFAGPARTGKTMGLILGGITYVVTCAPGDALAVHMSQDAARDFSRMDLDRAIRHSPELSSRLSPRARDDNTYDKAFRSGIMLKLGWPAVSQLSAKTLQYVFLIDYDRPENVHNVDGEGPMWGLAYKRTETYMSRGKCVAESSPGEDQTEPNWFARSPHEAPPVRGILSIYNTGTRARWYWPCQHCDQHFEASPGLKCFRSLPEFDELCEAVQSSDLMSLADGWAKVVCPHCGCLHEPEQRTDMNRSLRDGDRIRGATWIHEGERLEDCCLQGERRRTQIASYWLGGVAAAYQTWPSILHEYLQAVLTYVRTGDESPLRRTTNTDQGAVYLPIAASRRRSAEELVQRQEEWPRGVVPEGVRFLTAAVDVQSSRFAVTVMGWGVGLESWLIERFSITASRRPEGDRFAGLDPAAYVEDWYVLQEEVIERAYPVAGADVQLKPLLTLGDSGGREGVTDKAYEFWRFLRAKGLNQRFMLVKGVGNLNAPRVHQTWPDARARKDRKAGRGDVPVWLLNVNSLKDGIAGDLARAEHGPGFVHLPDWLDDGYFAEIMAETRTAKGWVREGHTPNEAFDLHAYNRAACIVLRAEAIDWKTPPEWASEPAGRQQRAEEREAKKGSRGRASNWVTQW